MRQNESERKWTVLTVRLPEDTAERFRKLCESEYRSLSKELRRMIEERVADVELEEAA